MSEAYQVVNPATGELEASYRTFEPEQVERTLHGAAAAYQRWRRTESSERSRLLQRVADLYDERAADLAAQVTREMGKPVREARGELALVADIFRWYAERGADLLADVPVTPRMGGRGVIRKEPVGVLLGVMPWNFPHYQVARFVAPNLMVGNVLLVKHAPQCPGTADAIEQLVADAGAPEGLVSNLLVTDEQAADVIADPRVAGVSVTGSERAGRAVAEVAGRNLKKVVLELGGNDVFLVLDADDVAAAAKAAVRARMGNAGQACNAGKRIVVTRDVADAFVPAFVAGMAAMEPGDPTDPSCRFGPLSSERAVRLLEEQIADAVGKGATVHTGGHRIDRPGAWLEATVLTGVTPDMRAWHEELFGPVAVVHEVADTDAAVELANDSPYGLGGVVWSADVERAEAVAARLDTGMVWINSPQGTAADLPFGGTKRSGVGRELGALGIEEFVNHKLVFTPGR